MFYFTLLFFSLPREKRKRKKKGKKKQKIKFKSLIYLSPSRPLSSLTNTPSNHNNSLLFSISLFFLLDQYMNTSPSQAGTYLPRGTLLSNKQQIKNSSLHHNIHLFFLPSLLGVQVSPKTYLSNSPSPQKQAPTYMYPNLTHHLFSSSSFTNSNFSPKYTGRGIVGTTTSNLKSSGN